MLESVLTLAAAYLLGSIPFSYLVARAFGVADVRNVGSGNVGATNVMRSAGRGPGIAALVLDALKGAAASVAALRLFPQSEWLPPVAAVAAVVGHVFPVWLGFRGGKGVATALGILLALAWPIGLIACAVWLLAALLFRYSSLSALLAILAAPIAAWFLANRQIAEFALFITILVWLRHHENIRRLLKGEESKIRLGGAKGAPH
jgi:acyl phosphate:glycerol-3-phosphate acyltransferase